MEQEREAESEFTGKPGVMTKAELVDEVARTIQVTKKQAETIVNVVFDSIVDSLRNGEKILLAYVLLRGENDSVNRPWGPPWT